MPCIHQIHENILHGQFRFTQDLWLAKFTHQDGKGGENDDKAIKINPSFAPAWLNKGNALDRIGSKDEGWACLREGFRLQGH